jgi:hypothetical protein
MRIMAEVRETSEVVSRVWIVVWRRMEQIKVLEWHFSWEVTYVGTSG